MMNNNTDNENDNTDNLTKDPFLSAASSEGSSATATTTTRTTTSAGRIKEPREGHSRKQQKLLLNHRKDMVFSLSSQGYNQSQISGILKINQSTVSLTIQQLRKDAAASMKQFLSEKLPLIYNECYESISQVINRSWQLVNDERTPIQARVALLSLISDATEVKMDLSSGGEIIEQGIDYANNVKKKFVEITKTNDILHNDDDDTEATAEEENNGHKTTMGDSHIHTDKQQDTKNDDNSDDIKKNGKVF